MLTAHSFAAASPARPDSPAKPKAGPSGFMPKLLIALMILTATLWQTAGTTLAQESAAAGETKAVETDVAVDSEAADKKTTDATSATASTDK